MPEKRFRNVFLSSIRQDSGKTMVSLGLYRVLLDKKIKTSFIKPVGQKYVSVGDLNIDKDSYLIGEVFKCSQKFKEMSPVTIGRGYTEKYIMSKKKDPLKDRIMKSFKSIVKGTDAVIVEGTGHAGVGSVVDVSNADVAKLLGSKVIIICEGGMGKSIDEIMLNKALFDNLEVPVLGVIINKVLPEKYDRIKKILTKGLADKGLPLLGVIPFEPLLSSPSVEQIMKPLKLRLLSGAESMHRRIKHTIVAAMEPHNMVHHLKTGTLVITSGDRIDNILLAVSSHLIRAEDGSHISGMILTGGLMPNPKIVNLLKKSKIPVLITDADTYTVAAKYERLTCKIQKTDKEKITKAARLVKKYVDVKYIMANA